MCVCGVGVRVCVIERSICIHRGIRQLYSVKYNLGIEVNLISIMHEDEVNRPS